MVSGALRWRMRGEVGVVLLVSKLNEAGSAHFVPLSLLPSSVRRSITHTLGQNLEQVNKRSFNPKPMTEHY